MERAGVIPATPCGTARAQWRPKVGTKCNARWPGDKQWYLAEIRKVAPDGLHVKFLSQGNDQTAVVQSNCVRPVMWDRPLTAQWSR